MVESLVIPDERFGKAVLLRDPEGITEAVASIPAPLVPVVASFDGDRMLAEIAQEASVTSGVEMPIHVVIRIAEELDEALFLDSPRYRRARRRVEDEFARAEVRPAAHAGGAYPEEPGRLRRYIDGECIAGAGAPKHNGSGIVGLIAPHIDPWRGRKGYGKAYGLLRASLAEQVDTFVLLGTSHAPMKEPFALCRKPFDTPLGALQADFGAIDAIASQSPFDPYADMFNHKREHSLEFQALFVRHVVGPRPVRIVPILCGLSDSQRTGQSPEQDERVEQFVRALRAVCDHRRDRTIVIAGADLAHVGPRFGDGAPYADDERIALEATDRASLDLAAACAHRDFFAHVQQDLDRRRVCGLGPIYTLLRVLPEGSRGDVVHYEQTIDRREGSIVSHAAVGFWA